MKQQNDNNNKQEISEDNVDNSLSFNDIYDIIMRIKNNFLRENLLLALEYSKDPERLNNVAKSSIYLLLKQQKEADEFEKRIQRGEVTVQELASFCENRWHSIYCLSCFEQIKNTNTDKVIKCSSCELCFHKECFEKGNNSGDICIVCRDNN